MPYPSHGRCDPHAAQCKKIAERRIGKTVLRRHPVFGSVRVEASDDADPYQKRPVYVIKRSQIVRIVIRLEQRIRIDQPPF